MYYTKEVRGYRLPLDVSDQQRDHAVEASEILATQVNRKVRNGRVKYV